MLESEITKSYNSLSGSDIRAVIGHQQFAEIQAISYTVTREKAPIYTMGSPDPRSFSRNKRGIAGSLIWINFDRHALLSVFHRARGQACMHIFHKQAGSTRTRGWRKPLRGSRVCRPAGSRGPRLAKPSVASRAWPLGGQRPVPRQPGGMGLRLAKPTLASRAWPAGMTGSAAWRHRSSTTVTGSGPCPRASAPGRAPGSGGWAAAEERKCTGWLLFPDGYDKSPLGR